MEYTLQKERFNVCEAVLDSASEQSIDLDLSLPDYCPDIERILKCRLCPVVSSKSITGDRLDIDGTAVIRLYYLDPKKQAVRLCEHRDPFSCSFPLKNSEGELISCVRLRPEYINCRAVSPRRLDIHGAFSVLATVYSCAQRELCSSIEGDDIEQSCHSEEISTLEGLSQQQISISEVLDIGQGKSTPESILRSELSVSLGECRAIDDKLMLRGEAVLRVLYTTDVISGAQDTMSFNIPVSGIVDVRGISESTINDISLDVMNYDVTLRSEFDEGSTLIALDAKLLATVFAYGKTDVQLIEEAYSKEYELETEKKPCSLTRILSLADMTISAKDELKTGDAAITKVTDLWCDSMNYICTASGDGLMIKGKAGICMLAIGSDGVPLCAEKAVDFSVSPDHPKAGGTLSARPDITVNSLGFRITGDNSVEIKADIRVRAAICETVTSRCICGAKADENHKKQRDTKAALTLFYAEPGERIWDIAQKYCTSAEAIRMENELTEDVISERTMVMIPM